MFGTPANEMIKNRNQNQKIKGSLGIAFTALSLISLGWIMQAYSIFDWESAFELGLQQGTFEGSELESLIARKEKGEAMADLILPLPLTILAFVGLVGRKFYGWLAAMMVFSICIYFPLFYLFQQLGSDIQVALFAIVMWAIPSMIGIVALWSIRNHYFQYG